MFASAIHQLRYAFGLLYGERMPADSLSRLARDLVATVREFGEPGEDSQLLPGQQGPADPAVARSIAARGLRKTAVRAASRTAYYAELFRTSTIKPDELTLDTWTELPVTPKSALRGAPGAFVAAGVEPALLALTTGTTGQPTSVWLSRREVDMIMALNTIAAVLRQRLRPGHVVAYAGSSRATVPVVGVGSTIPAVGAALVQIGIIDPEVAVERLAAPVPLPGAPRQVTHLTTPTSNLAALVGAAERGGWSAADFGLESIVVGGEALTAALRARATAAFGAEVSIGYLLTEAMPAGASLCGAGHLHYGTEFAYFEVLDPVTYRPTKPGEIGTVVVTPYLPYRECTMLLRYVTGDLVRVPDTPPTCELAALPATSDILGRYTGPVSMRVPHREVLEVLESEPGVPLPARYWLTDDPAGPLLHVYLEEPAVVARLEERVATCGLDIAGIVPHDDLEEARRRMPVRADLREASFDRHRAAIPVGSTR